MANIKSAIRRIKVTERNHARNVDVKSDLKTKVKKVRLETKAEAAKGLLLDAQKTLSKAAGKGVIHKRQAARRTSRLAKKVNKLAKA